MLVFVGITLRVYDGVPKWLLFTAFCLAGAAYPGQATNFTWANTACKDDDQLRAVVVASMNMWSNVFVAWWGLVFCKWSPVHTAPQCSLGHCAYNLDDNCRFLDPATDAPKWRKGNIVTIVMAILTLLVSEGVRILDKPGREQRLRELNAVNDSDAQHIRVHDAEKERDGVVDAEKASTRKSTSNSREEISREVDENESIHS